VTLSCPHCGGEIVGLAGGTSPFPGWRNPDAIPTQLSRNTGAPADIAHGSGSKPSAKRTPYNQGYDPLFLEFWNVYPLKRDKRKALNAWRNAVARAPHNVIVQGARRYREDPNRRAGFTKYAEGWLNGDGWEDEPLPPRIDPRARPADPPRPMTSGEMSAAIERELDRG
jgi:hypothetical protein